MAAVKWLASTGRQFHSARAIGYAIEGSHKDIAEFIHKKWASEIHSTCCQIQVRTANDEQLWVEDWLKGGARQGITELKDTSPTDTEGNKVHN